MNKKEQTNYEKLEVFLRSPWPGEYFCGHLDLDSTLSERIKEYKVNKRYPLLFAKFSEGYLEND